MIPTSYTSALIADYQFRKSDFTWGTVYVGGGTPSLWAFKDAKSFFEVVDLNDVTEFTIEANPDDVDSKWLDQWRAIGATRISIGVQSFDDGYLSQLGRNHDGKTAYRAVELAMQAGFVVTMDLIYGGPHHTETVLRSDIDKVFELEPHHVSAYELTVEANTVFSRLHQKGELNRPSDETLQAIENGVVNRLSEKGYSRYEVSSFARNSQLQSAHNSNYWVGLPYLGVGIGAHSFSPVEMQRSSVPRDLRSYIEQDWELEVDDLSALDHWFELCFLAARTTIPFRLSSLFERFVDLPIETMECAEKVFRSTVSREWATFDGSDFKMSDLGLAFADAVGFELAEILDFRGKSEQ